jgi:uncharacterized protein YqhQ
MEQLKLPTYGGQAVIEGVMMRGKTAMAIAMRAPDQSIVVHQENLSSIYRSNLVKIPFLRGLVMLWDALGLGIRALTISANTQTGEDEKVEGPALYIALAVSLTFAVALFFLVPALVGYLTDRILLVASLDQTIDQVHWVGSLIEGVTRLAILIGYIWLIGRIPEIRRVFAYHGAEHKTINAFEAGAELTPQSVSCFSLEHPRCGTAFLLTLVVFSVLIFTLLGPMPLGVRLISRIILIPVIAGVAYEYIRWTANHLNSRIVQLIVKPNLALQRLTTREPNLEMLEVSIAAFQAMRSGEREINL